MRSLLLVGALCACSLGCGPQEEKLPLVPASGELSYQDKPLEGYEVFFRPADPQQPRAGGVTDAEGRFVLRTGGEEGALPGTHQVYIVKQLPPPEGEPGREIISSTPAEPSVLPRKYEAPDSSGLEIEIPETGNEAIELKL